MNYNILFNCILGIVLLFFVRAIILEINYLLNMFQLLSYNLDQINIWFTKNIKKFILNIILIIAHILFIICLNRLNAKTLWKIEDYIFGLFLLLIIVICILFLVLLIVKNIKRKNVRKPLVYTARIKRNIACILLLIILPFARLIYVVFSTALVNKYFQYEGSTLISIIVYYLENLLYISFILAPYVLLITPILVFLSYLIMLPIENYFKSRFVKKAKKRLHEDCKARVVGITGSFGKTSVKNFLYKFLSCKYNVCASPASFNTPMGAVRTINESLKSYDDILLQEMGARRVGDIKEVATIVEPLDAIITEVGEMHLDTFKSLDNVLKTKMELVEDVVARWKKGDRVGTSEIEGGSVGNNVGGGVIVLNGDNQLIRDYVSKSSWSTDKNIMKNIYFVGENKDNDLIIENIVSGKDGASFELRVDGLLVRNLTQDLLTQDLARDPSPVLKNLAAGLPHALKIDTKLIGKNNILDISFAAVFALLKGIDIDDIKNEVRKLEQVKARLEVMNIDENTIIINDGYNSNPVGAKNAIDALTTFEGYKKIIVTPGMVELGEKQYEENKKMAEYAAENLDEVVVVGNVNKNALMEGAKRDLQDGEIKFFENEEEAINYARVQQAKKVILLENDIPDNY